MSGEHQSKLTLMSESLRNDGRIWVPKNREDCDKDPREIPEEDRDYYLERIYPSFGNLVPARHRVSPGEERLRRRARGRSRWSATSGAGSTSTSPTPSSASAGRPWRRSTATSSTCTPGSPGENPYQVPMRIYPAVHYVMGGLWVDYDLQSTIPGLFVTGEANFSDHGANRLGASALMQGLADGYFVLPNTIRDYLAKGPFTPLAADDPAVAEARGSVERRTRRLLEINGERSVDSFHKELGNDHVGVLRDGAHRGGAAQGHRPHPRSARGVLAQRPCARVGRHAQPEPREGRPRRRLPRARGAHVHRRPAPPRVVRRSLPGESQTEDGEALRNDDEFLYVAAWEFEGGDGDGEMGRPVLHKEDLVYEAIELKQRSLQVTRGRPSSPPSRPTTIDDHPSHVRKDSANEPHPEDLASGRTAPPRGDLVAYKVKDISPDMSFLEMLDVLNEQLNAAGRGAHRVRLRLSRGHLRHLCGLMISGEAHGPRRRRPASCTCAASPTARSSRSSRGGPTPSRSSRTSSSTAARSTGSSRPAATSRSTPGRLPTRTRPRCPSRNADRAFQAAECIQCGACVAACPNASAMLFLGAKVTHLAELPQGQPERMARVVKMVDQHDAEGFGGCTNVGACSQACPKGIPQDVISTLNNDLRTRCARAQARRGSPWPDPDDRPPRGPASQPERAGPEQGVADEGDDVEDRVRDDERHDPPGAGVEPPEDQPHDEVPDEAAEPLVEVVACHGSARSSR